MQTKTFKVPTISCGHCVRTITNEIGELHGVKDVSVDLESKTVTVKWDEPPQTWQSIKTLMEEINHPPQSLEDPV